MTHLPLFTLCISAVTLLILAYIAGSFVKLYDLLSEQNKRISIASVFCVLFSVLEHGIRSFCTVFSMPMPESVALLEMGSLLFLVCWVVLTMLEMKDTLLIDLQDSFNTWKKNDI